MGFVEIILLAIGVSMDAFAVSICKGLAAGRVKPRQCMVCGAWFGGFQALMPLLGFFLGSLFAGIIEAFDHWVAFGLLAVIGVNMLKEAFSTCSECQTHTDDFAFKTMLVMAIATSIDALAVGISLAMAGNVRIVPAVALIGLTTFGFSAAGVKLGSLFGSRFHQKAQLGGGIILILLGLKILLEHLGVLS